MPGPVLPKERFGHKGGVDPLTVGNLFDHQPVGHDVVGHGQGILIAHVDFVLGRGHFVMGVLNFHPQVLAEENRFPTKIQSFVAGDQIEISAPIQDFRGLRVFEIKIFQFRSGVKRKSFLFDFFQVFLQHITRISFEGLPVRGDDVAEHPRHPFFLGPPGQDGEGGRIGDGHHVALVDADESFDGGPVKPDSLVQRFFNFLFGDGKTLEKSQNVRKPEFHELDVVLLNLLHHCGDVRFCHFFLLLFFHDLCKKAMLNFYFGAAAVLTFLQTR